VLLGAACVCVRGGVLVGKDGEGCSLRCEAKVFKPASRSMSSPIAPCGVPPPRKGCVICLVLDDHVVQCSKCKVKAHGDQCFPHAHGAATQPQFAAPPLPLGALCFEVPFSSYSCVSLQAPGQQGLDLSRLQGRAWTGLVALALHLQTSPHQRRSRRTRGASARAKSLRSSRQARVQAQVSTQLFKARPEITCCATAARPERGANANSVLENITSQAKELICVRGVRTHRLL
jgi:hypothetical protein